MSEAENSRDGKLPQQPSSWGGLRSAGGWGREGQEDPQSRELRVGDDKGPLCLDSGWRRPEAQGRGLGVGLWRRKLVRGKTSGMKQRKVREEEAERGWESRGQCFDCHGRWRILNRRPYGPGWHGALVAMVRGGSTFTQIDIS